MDVVVVGIVAALSPLRFVVNISFGDVCSRAAKIND